ncbi:MAG: bifunctional 2',3'-cyclic-nucleotide 2'-phosphodiesterase/3'-nucleotidase [Paracoccaceae bacterium]
MTLPEATGLYRRYATTQTTLDLRVMQTTDLHAHIMAYDYLADRPSDRTGLVRLASLIRSARAEQANTILLDTGDFLQGTILGDVHAMSRKAGTNDTHPMIAAMNSLGYDAGTLGNHDFNYGLPFLVDTLQQTEFPVVCANVARKLGDTATNDATLLPPWTILARRLRDQCGNWQDLKIGIIGVLPPQTEIWERAHLEGHLHTRDMLKAARGHLPALRAAGADIVILLSHSGIAPDTGMRRTENAALQLAALCDVDAVLCGHQHQMFPGPDFEGIAGVDTKAGTLHGKPAVMAGFWGSHLGVIDLKLAKDHNGWQIISHRSNLRPICDPQADAGQGRALVADDGTVAALTLDAHHRTLTHMRRLVGHSSKPLHSFFALVADDPSLQLVAEAQRVRVAKILEGTTYADLPLLSAVAPFKAGGLAGPTHFTDVPAGPLCIRNLADLYLFPNRLSAVTVTGTALMDWLEHAAGQFYLIRKGKPDQMLRDASFPCHNFDVICGLRYTIDPFVPPRFAPDGRLQHPNSRRVRDITYDNRPVQPDQTYVVATNNYRANGGGFASAVAMTEIRLDRPQGRGSETIRAVLADHISRHSVITPSTTPVWRFVSAPGTTALFDSAPAAAEALHDLTGVRIESAGPGPNGFMRFRLYF